MLAAETHAFADDLDFASIMRHDLDITTGKYVPITILTDSKCLFDMIAKETTTTERRLMIETKSAREAYEK